MTNTKAQVGDLIRITDKASPVVAYEVGGIYEVVGYIEERTEDEQVAIIGIGGITGYVDHHEYVIHRKAGEEDSCDNCGKQGVHTCRGAEYHASLHVGESVVPAQSDAVNSPQHYTQGRFETIEVIEEITSGYNDGYVAYCVGNALKYEARAPFKHATPLEDLRKAARYLAYAIDYLDAKSTQ